MLTALQLQPPLREVPWEHCCWNSREEGLHSLILPDRIQSSLSEGKKGLCWAHPRTRGPYGCTEVRRVCCQCCLAGSRIGRVVTPHFPPQPLASPTESKVNRKSSKRRRSTPASQDAVAGKHRLTSAWALHCFFHMSTEKEISNRYNPDPQSPNTTLWTSDRWQKERFSTELASGVLMC